MDRNGKFVNFLAGSDELFVSKSQIIGNNLNELLPPELAKKTIKKVQETLNTGGITNYEYELPIKGTKQYYECRMVKSENDIVLSIIRNISARKFAKEKLGDSEKRFRSISENAPFGISIYQHDKWVFVNPAVKKISGYSKEELMKMNFWEIVHEDFREMARKLGKKRQKG